MEQPRGNRFRNHGRITTGSVTGRIGKFSGSKTPFYDRRKNGNVYIDDYAHHPTAVKYMIEAARIKYPDKKSLRYLNRIVILVSIILWIVLPKN